MVDLHLAVVTLVGQEYVVFPRKDGDGPAFPHDTFADGELPAAAAKRVVKDWSGTTDPKLELMDFVAGDGALTFVFRAFLTEEPKGDVTRFPRGGLPDGVAPLPPADVEVMQKTSLSYKLTRG